MPSELPRNRLFFALWPDDGVRADCANAARQVRLRMQPRGHASSVERYHITLLFLGDEVPAAAEAAARQAASLVHSPPFKLRLDHASCFRNREVPWWLGSFEPPAALRVLYDRLREAMQSARVPMHSMRFAPHLTIQRDARVALPPTRIDPIDWPVGEFVLIRSHLDRRPVEYELLGRWSLDPDASAERPETGQMSLL